LDTTPDELNAKSKEKVFGIDIKIAGDLSPSSSLWVIIYESNKKRKLFGEKPMV
jgi:hypothetical protein